MIPLDTSHQLYNYVVISPRLDKLGRFPFDLSPLGVFDLEFDLDRSVMMSSSLSKSESLRESASSSEYLSS